MDAGSIRELKRLGVEWTLEEEASDISESARRRSTVSYADQNDRFILRESGFERQFAQTYFCRYHELKVHLVEKVRKKWQNAQILRILDIKDSESEEVVICGILFKSMKLKPQVLDKYLSKRAAEKELQKNKNRVSDDDSIFLEDEGTRIQLTGEALNVKQLVSGVCLAAKGRQTPEGKFEVLDVCYPGFAPQPSFPSGSGGQDQYLALISGLNMATSGPQSRLALDLMAQYLTEMLSSTEAIPKDVVHVVICGGLVGKNEDLATGAPNSRQQLRALEPIIAVDRFVDDLARVLPLDIMPGPYDPANFLMPQQPLHKHKEFRRVTNPHCFELNGVKILGTSGQNVNDILLHSDLANGLEVLEQCLLYRHLAPTCPDTLTCFPFNQTDPFVLEETPHIFFAGDQPGFMTQRINGHDVTAQLICVPDFSLSNEVVLVNLCNLNTQTIYLDASLMDTRD